MITALFSCGNGIHERINVLKKKVDDLRDRFEIIIHTVSTWRSNISQICPLKAVDKVRIYKSFWLLLPLILPCYISTRLKWTKWTKWLKFIVLTVLLNDRLSPRGIICQNDFWGFILKVWFVNIFDCFSASYPPVFHNWQTLHVLAFHVLLGVGKHWKYEI